MKNLLVREKTGLWIMDVQERLFPQIERSSEILAAMCFALKAARLFGLFLIVTEQYPEGLGSTVEAIKKSLPSGQPIYSKTTFSGYADIGIRKAIEKSPVDQWIIMGIEAHICILQTVKDLIGSGKKVIVPTDGVSSRSI